MDSIIGVEVEGDAKEVQKDIALKAIAKVGKQEELVEVKESEQEPNSTTFSLEQYSNNNQLPREMLCLIFESCLDDQKTLLNCRLICKSWKYATDNYSALMRKLTFTIYDWESFEKSTIMDTVKLIRIIKPWDVNVDGNKRWVEFIRRLGQTVEKITFDFFNLCHKSSVSMQQATKITISLLTSCGPRLKQLAILHPALLNELAATEITDLQVFANVQHLSLFISAQSLRKLIFRFPNLVTIEIKNGNNVIAETDIRKILCEYIKQNSSGSLKIISMDGSMILNPQSWFRFFFTCANREIKLECMSNWMDLHVEHFLLYEEIPEAPINEFTCKYFNSGTLELEIQENPMAAMRSTEKIGFCTNIFKFNIDFYRAGTLEELLFLQKLQQLEELTLSGLWVQEDEEDFEDEEPIVLCAYQVFECGFPMLSRLVINVDIFGNINTAAQAFSSFHLYFPNLEYLFVLALEFVPPEIFVYLSKLDSLHELRIDGYVEQGLLNHFTNEMFTQPCQSQRPEREQVEEFVPAITAFRSLKELSISCCPDLDDLCVLNGIVLSQTLTDVTLDGIRSQLTEASFEALRNTNFVQIFGPNDFYFQRG